MILIIDDQPIYRALFGAALELAGYEVKRVETGWEGLSLIQEAKAVILDYTLIDMECQYFLDHLNQHAIEIPVIVSIATFDPVVIAMARRYGVRRFLPKYAYSPEVLRDLVNFAVGQSRRDEEIARLCRQVLRVRDVGSEVRREIEEQRAREVEQTLERVGPTGKAALSN